MPLRRKSNHTFRNVLIGVLILSLIILMIISFAPAQNITEIVLYP